MLLGNELSSSPPTKSGKVTIMIPDIRNAPDPLTTWSGPLPFTVRAKQVDVWVRLRPNRSQGGLDATGTTLTVHLITGERSAVVREVDIPKEAFRLNGDPSIQVLIRWDCDLNVARGSLITIDFTCPKAEALGIVGHGLSHIDFRTTPKRPSPLAGVVRHELLQRTDGSIVDRYTLLTAKNTGQGGDSTN
jgi:hypothetical protein